MHHGSNLSLKSCASYDLTSNDIVTSIFSAGGLGEEMLHIKALNVFSGPRSRDNIGNSTPPSPTLLSVLLIRIQRQPSRRPSNPSTHHPEYRWSSLWSLGRTRKGGQHARPLSYNNTGPCCSRYQRSAVSIPTVSVIVTCRYARTHPRTPFLEAGGSYEWCVTPLGGPIQH